MSTKGDNPFDHVFSNMHIILKHAGHAGTIRSPVTLPGPGIQSLYQKTEASRTIVTQDKDAPIQQQNCFEMTTWDLFLDPDREAHTPLFYATSGAVLKLSPPRNTSQNTK